MIKRREEANLGGTCVILRQTRRGEPAQMTLSQMALSRVFAWRKFIQEPLLAGFFNINYASRETTFFFLICRPNFFKALTELSVCLLESSFVFCSRFLSELFVRATGWLRAIIGIAFKFLQNNSRF